NAQSELGELDTSYVQDSTYVLSISIFDENGVMRLPDLKEWRFKEGNDTIWADPKFDRSDWVKLSPEEISAIEVNEDRVFEGWFTIKIKLDSSFYKQPLYLGQSNTAAADIYVDGQLFQSFGNTNFRDKEYKGKRNFIDSPQGISWPINQEIFLAAHFVEYHESFYQMPKGFSTLGHQSFLYFFNKKSFQRFQNVHLSHNRLGVIIITTLSILVILFWLIVLFNRSQVHMIYLATTTTLFLLPTLFSFLGSFSTSTSNLTFFLEVLEFPVAVAFMSSFIFLIANILGVRVHWLIKLYVTVGILISFSGYFLSEITKHYAMAMAIPVAATCLYYLIRYRKNLKGPKAIIVYGLLLTLSLGIFFRLFPILESYYVPFALPLSLLVYLAFWLKDMIRDIHDKADEVVRVSNEKKELVENQNVILENQVSERTSELNQSLENLKSTQTQLVHSEKMASLGELTAGIAHEIQNPLNFVNNFSDLNKELLEELKDAVAQNDQEEVTAIIKDLSENELKINHHGKRAEEIVKSMLQHSRTGSGEKELTDINALADEYLRLSYHGLRAKDKSFNADFKEELDPELPKIKVIPQDIGRVILNLINNAFQAVKGVEKPLVLVSTKKIPLAPFEKGDSSKSPLEGGQRGVLITVSDNGSGIPDNIREKIFQPFFTTKPTGQGTGLGLSMSYDIVTKGHGGTIEVESEEGIGTKFTMHLPI
ncbi:MAG: signal transduction histidine kinase, partial [Marinoscillum sp.]